MEPSPHYLMFDMQGNLGWKKHGVALSGMRHHLSASACQMVKAHVQVDSPRSDSAHLMRCKKKEERASPSVRRLSRDSTLFLAVWTRAPGLRQSMGHNPASPSTARRPSIGGVGGTGNQFQCAVEGHCFALANPDELCKVVGINGWNAGGKGIGHCSGPFLSHRDIGGTRIPASFTLARQPAEGIWSGVVPSNPAGGIHAMVRFSVTGGDPREANRGGLSLLRMPCLAGKTCLALHARHSSFQCILGRCNVVSTRSAL